MIVEVGKYALINAKLRARISNILSDDFFTSLIKSPSLTEMLNMFRNSTFAKLAAIYEETGDLKMVELALYKSEATIFIDIEKYLPKEAISVSRSYAMGYEIENLKNTLRLFFDRTFRKRTIDNSIHYLMREQLLHTIPFDAIINASSFDEIVRLLSATPYKNIVQQRIPEVNRLQSLFPLTSALDRFYYQQLLDRVAELSVRDRSIAHRLIGIEIDLQNINWIIRFRSYYNLSFDDVSDLIIPGGFTVKGPALRDIYQSQQLSSPLESMLKKNYPGIAVLLAKPGHDQNARLQMIEHILEQIMLVEVQRIMRGYPFTIGIVLAYYILKRLEIKRIRTVLNAGFYHISKERTASLL